ncbi:MAG TPA: hypothetical protein PK110_05345 [Niabella sp.]|nr:hypothetical protein [Chitinophagaceae bacterium]HRN47968.1 hypothetical protein [Niabella sp.]HRO84230.1 hypothetical protein [Niabella sp.]HUN04269.1 hypothetical protein [Niabella sp.]
MKFRKMVLVIIFLALAASYFTKPTQEDFKNFLASEISRTEIHPVIEFHDYFLYCRATATFVDIEHPVITDNKKIAMASKQEYVGWFKHFWELKN